MPQQQQQLRATATTLSGSNEGRRQEQQDESRSRLQTDFTTTNNAALPLLPKPDGTFDYHEPPIRTKYSLPDPILHETETMIVLVPSARENAERRAAIRETWAHGHAVYFILGGPFTANDPNQRALENEQSSFHDLLDTLHPDTYAALPYKLKYAYTWVTSMLPRVEWIVKVDDDTVVRVDSLRNFLAKFNPNVPTVIGRIIEASGVAKTGKWAEYKYPHAQYPYWPQGSCGHVVSRAVASYVATLQEYTFYQGEDTSLGIWLDESDLQVTWINSGYFSNERQCMKHVSIVLFCFVLFGLRKREREIS
jgi:hypothetical protein